MTKEQIYLDFIHYSIATNAGIPDSVPVINWGDFLEYCNRQGVIGLVFEGVQKADVRIPQDKLFEWIGFSESIRAQNRIVNQRIQQVQKFFEEKNCRTCVLKGQANSLMYPNPEVRSPGDIDIWVEGKRDDIIRMVLSVAPDAHYSIHHIKMPVFSDVSVEVHYRPMYLSNWFKDKKLQRYITEVEERQFSHKVSLGKSEIGCLTNDFNVVYQLLHMYAHFFSSRNNFKQFVDYFYLLKKGLTAEEKCVCEGKFKELGIEKYASGIMWIMEKVLGLDSALLVIPTNEKIGRLILKESAYFGTYSTSNLKYVLEQFKANIRIVRYFPKEVLISPLFLVWHQWWKLKTKLALSKR